MTYEELIYYVLDTQRKCHIEGMPYPERITLTGEEYDAVLADIIDLQYNFSESEYLRRFYAALADQISHGSTWSLYGIKIRKDTQLMTSRTRSNHA